MHNIKMLSKLNLNYFKCVRHLYISNNIKSNTNNSNVYERKMFGWQIHDYGDEAQYSDSIKIPIILDSNEVLVKINATSINPIDILIASKLSILFKKYVRLLDIIGLCYCSMSDI